MSESEAARRELKSLEEEIGRVKAQLRELGPPTTTASSAAAAVTDTGAVSSAIPHPQEDRENDGNDKGGVTSPPGDAGEEPATLAASSSTTITTNSLAVTWISVRHDRLGTMLPQNSRRARHQLFALALAPALPLYDIVGVDGNLHFKMPRSCLFCPRRQALHPSTP
jgi:hypothetical protein